MYHLKDVKSKNKIRYDLLFVEKWSKRKKDVCNFY